MTQREELKNLRAEITIFRDTEDRYRKWRQELESEARKLLNDILSKCQRPDCELTCEDMLCLGEVR